MSKIRTADVSYMIAMKGPAAGYWVKRCEPLNPATIIRSTVPYTTFDDLEETLDKFAAQAHDDLLGHWRSVNDDNLKEASATGVGVTVSHPKSEGRKPNGFDKRFGRSTILDVRESQQ